MPVVYVHQASDFVTGVPDEAGFPGASTSGMPITLTLSPTAVPIAVLVDDADANLDEIDATQTLGQDVTLNGSTYTTGTPVAGAYNFINSGNGHEVTAIHIDAGATNLGFGGPVVGLMSTVALVPGQSYTFDTQESTYSNPQPYSIFVACFTEGTSIDLADGTCNVEDLSSGDWVPTLDNGLQQVKWIGRREVAAKGDFAPVVFMPGSIGNDVEITVSPQHRMLISGWQCQQLFGEDEVLVPASHLLNGDTIYRRTGGDVTYFHLLFDQHEIIMSNGLPSESFHPSAAAVSSFDLNTKRELLSLFPELASYEQAYGPTARRVLKKYESRVLAAY